MVTAASVHAILAYENFLRNTLHFHSLFQVSVSLKKLWICTLISAQASRDDQQLHKQPTSPLYNMTLSKKKGMVLQLSIGVALTDACRFGMPPSHLILF